VTTQTSLRVPQDVVDEIVDRANCGDVAQHFAAMVPYRNHATRFFCPWCQPDNNSKRGSEGKFSTGAHDGRGWVCFKRQSPECERGGTALDLAAKLHGWELGNGDDFLDAIEWLARIAGVNVDAVQQVRAAREARGHVKPRRPAPSVRTTPNARPRRVDHVLPPGALAPVWAELERRNRARAAKWLEDERGVRADDVGSGFAILESSDVAGLPWPALPYTTGDGDEVVFSEWMCAQLAGHLMSHGASIVVPIRSPTTGDVDAFNLRPLGGGRRRTISRQSDPDGAPRGYGLVHESVRAQLVVMTEGAVDTMAAESLLAGTPGVVVVGAIYANQMRDWAEWLAPRLQPRARVVIIRHLDELSEGRDGAGQVNSRKALAALHAAGVSAQPFKWRAFLDELHDAGGDPYPLVGDSLDLAEVLRIAKALALPFASVRDAFRRSIGVAQHSAPAVEVKREHEWECDDAAPPPTIDDMPTDYDVEDIISDGWGPR
jgi:hypothetical protein